MLDPISKVAIVSILLVRSLVTEDSLSHELDAYKDATC